MPELRALKVRLSTKGRCPRHLWRHPRDFQGPKIVVTIALAVVLAGAATAGERLGTSFATTNDSLGEQLDRWQSTSLQVDILTGPEWTGRAPEAFGQVLNYRFRTDILTPEDLREPDPNDRRHAGVLAFGLHTYASRGAFDLRLGGDLFVIGPQTKLLEVQRDLHKILGFSIPTLDDFQIGNRVEVQGSGEAGRAFDAGPVRVRPFIEAQAGPEDLLRAGVDLSFGSIGSDDLLVRLPSTGHLVPAIRGSDGRGASFVLGADAAWVEDSVYLPEHLGYNLTSVRTRLRAGVHYEFDRVNVFYGFSWLGREFESQREGQFVGALQVGLRF